MSLAGAAAAAAGAIAGALSGDSGPDVKPGSVAAWALTFHADRSGDLGTPILSIGSDTYDGSIDATLPADLSGGTYEAVVEGMTDEDYAKIRNVSGPLAVKLHLWWKDSPSSILGDLANFTGLTDPLGAVTPQPPEHSLVAVLRVQQISRRAGQRRYEAVFTMHERVFARLGDARVQGLCYDSLDAAVNGIANAAGITITGHSLGQITPSSSDPNFASTAPGTALKSLQGPHGLVDQVRDGLKLYGPKVTLIRDGVLHLGKWNDQPLAQRTIDTEGGLAAVQRGGEQARDAAAGDPPAGAPTSRATVTVIALGRPDVKPGDTISVLLPPEDFPNTSPSSVGSALLTAATGFVTGSFDDEPPGPPKKCLVTEVKHKISRRDGFATTVRALVLDAETDDGWDHPQPAAAPPAQQPGRARGSVPADTAVAAARAVHDVMRDISGARGTRVGQIRKHPASTGSAPSPPRHSSEVWYADIANDGLPAAAARLPVTQDRHGEARDVPYLTPFAWGHYGMVLPRYPGTRVLLVNGPGGPSDAVDAGAIWNRGDGPPAEAGDYWLVLPIGVSPRDDIGSGDGQASDGPASHDLVDGDGARVIETKRFVIRVTDQPTDCTTRPTPGSDAPEGAVLIESKSGSNQAQIVLKSDGSITVKGSSITFDTSADGGDITLKAANVKVQVSGTMDVS